MSIWDKMPSIGKIGSQTLADGVKKAWEIAIAESTWDEHELSEIPFTLLIPDCPVNLLLHTESVTATAYAAAAELARLNPALNIDLDIVLAGGLIHDVGKLWEYEKKDGSVVKSYRGKLLRHPFSGAIIAARAGLPEEIQSIAATHSVEGERGGRTIEANIIYHADYINFESYKIML